MVRIFRQGSDLQLDEVFDITPKSWIHMTNPSDKDVERIASLTNISDSMLKTALDEEEFAHSDYENGNTMYVVDIPFIEEDENESGWFNYLTIPFGIIYNENFFVTVCLKETSIVSDFFEKRVRTVNMQNYQMLSSQIFYRNATKFMQYLRQMDKISHRVQTQLRKSSKNKEVLQLMDLEKSLVLFSTALNADHAIVDKLYRTTDPKNNTVVFNYLEDVLIEHKQAIEMCTIYRDILSGTMDAFASIISNNVNFVMRLLTAITIMLTIPTLIFSLWGMNVKVPFGAGSALWNYGFWIVLGIAGIITVCAMLIINHKSNRIK